MDNGSSLVGDLVDVQRAINVKQSAALDHAIRHPLHGKRRYRRGYARCKSCGGFLSPHDITMREIDAMSGVSEELKGPCLVPTVSGRGQSQQFGR